jgi:diketogulonate reductase-like aldo/keto reductase
MQKRNKIPGNPSVNQTHCLVVHPKKRQFHLAQLCERHEGVEQSHSSVSASATNQLKKIAKKMSATCKKLNAFSLHH